MKIKQDFVTNSSSTSYIFLFDGETKKDLFDSMKDNWRKFQIGDDEFDEYDKVNVSEIIEYIKNEVNVISIKNLIYNTEEIINDLRNRLKNYPENKYILEDIEKQKAYLMKLYQCDFSNGSYVNFHDNDGEKVGNLFTYEDRSFENSTMMIFKTGEKQ